jgi:hypothetical protein
MENWHLTRALWSQALQEEKHFLPYFDKKDGIFLPNGRNCLYKF